MSQRIAVLAGSGKLPAAVCNNILRKKKVPFLFILEEEDPPVDVPEQIFSSPFSLFSLENLFQTLEAENIKSAVTIGKFHKERLFYKETNDPISNMLLSKARNRNDMELFRAFLAYLHQKGIHLCSQLDFLEDHLPPKGVYGKIPSNEMLDDIQFGRQLAEQCATLDIGQSVMVSKKTIVAIEAIEGTDACIKRAGNLTKGQAGVLCKMPRKNQDPRFDIPGFGIQTLKYLAEQGGTGASIALGKVLVTDPIDEIGKYCLEQNLFLDIS
jgi:UDP-2,3-diacylglucosamine hydrolase